jgi:hypothetical protein
VANDDAMSSSTPDHVSESVPSSHEASVGANDLEATTPRPTASVPTDEAADVPKVVETGPALPDSLGDAGRWAGAGGAGVRLTASFPSAPMARAATAAATAGGVGRGAGREGSPSRRAGRLGRAERGSRPAAVCGLLAGFGAGTTDAGRSRRAMPPGAVSGPAS